MKWYVIRDHLSHTSPKMGHLWQIFGEALGLLFTCEHTSDMIHSSLDWQMLEIHAEMKKVGQLNQITNCRDAIQ